MLGSVNIIYNKYQCISHYLCVIQQAAPSIHQIYIVANKCLSCVCVLELLSFSEVIKKKLIQTRVELILAYICYLESEGEIMPIQCVGAGTKMPLTVTVTYASSGNGEFVLTLMEICGS